MRVDNEKQKIVNRCQVSIENYPLKNLQLKSGNPIKEKSFAFAVRIVRLYQYLCGEKREFVLSKQLLRSGTSVGALIREAGQAESKADFIHKLAIALKEANETEYWLDLLKETNYLEAKAFDSIKSDVIELLKLLTAIIKTSKAGAGS